MKTSELVLEFLQKQGFCPQTDEENGNITFRYQMLSFLFVNNDEDQSFFQLALPTIFDVTEDNYIQVLEAANEVNLGMKVVKVSVVRDSVWLFLESLLDHIPDISDIMPRALQILQEAQQCFYKKIIESDNSSLKNCHA